MENNKVLNVSCDFNGYQVYQIPANTVEVELKIKRTRGKYTLIKDAHMRTEKYPPWDTANRRAKVRTIKRRTPRRETGSKDIVVDNSTSSETDIPNGGFGYAPKIYTDPKLTATLPQIETECDETETAQKDFIGEYCVTCIKKYNRCWCNGLNWDVDLMEVEQPNSPPVNPTDTTNPTKRPNSIKLVSIRQPPPGWSEFRKGTLNKSNIASLDKIIIMGLRSISTEEFENM